MPERDSDLRYFLHADGIVARHSANNRANYRCLWLPKTRSAFEINKITERVSPRFTIAVKECHGVRSAISRTNAVFGMHNTEPVSALQKTALPVSPRRKSGSFFLAETLGRSVREP